MDMESFMAQAKSLQERVNAAQETLGKTIVRGIAGNGGCIITMTGKYDLVDLTLNDAVASQSASEIASIVMAAFQDAKAKADATIDKIMSDATSGMPEIPE